METQQLKNHQDFDVPVLIIGYSRIENIIAAINKLLEFGFQKIYIAIDFSNDDSIRIKQSQLIDYLSKQPHNRITVWYRKRNHGIAAGIISALDWFFAQNRFGVILEDDLIFEESFLTFCSFALNTYDKQEILMISGNRFDAIGVEEAPAFTNYPQIWGWATWQENWWEMRNLISARKKITLLELFSPRKCFLFAGAKRVEKGLLDTWDIPLAFEMLKGRKICLLPPVNLVSNIGFDSFSTHTMENKFPLSQPILPLLRIKLPEVKELAKQAKIRNRYLEKSVFGIRWYHLMSPIKMFLELIYKSRTNMNLISLNKRLEESEIAPSA